MPHHDGSSLYLSTEAPKIGQSVEFRVRVPKSYLFDKAMLRIYQDAEPRTFALKKLSESSAESWWGVKAEVLNPVAQYRFLFVGQDKYHWLNAAGIHDYDVTSVHDFQILAKPAYPSWIKASVFYQIFPDRFATTRKYNQNPPPQYLPREWNTLPSGRDESTGVEFFGGDLEGVENHLDHLTRLGVNGIYFTPFFPARSTHRYDASSFDFVDPLLGGDKALFSLNKVAAKNGIRIMGDLTTNHCGAGHPWIIKALKDEKSKERSFFYWDKSKHGYAGWWGLASLPKLNFSSTALRGLVYEGKNSIIKKWLRKPYNMAGWRIDVGNMTGRYFDQDLNQEVMRGIRKAMDEESPDAWLVAENADHFPLDLDGFGWHGTMNYNGFMRPVWGWLKSNPDNKYGFFGLDVDIPNFTGHQMVRAMKGFSSQVAWRSLVSSMTLLDSHDTARFRSVVGGDASRHLAGMGLLMTYPGVPSIFAGDEIGLEGRWGEDARRTINWDDRSGWDSGFYELLRTLIKVRRTSDGLANGGMRFIAIEDEFVAYLRESKKQSILVVVTRSGGKIKLDLATYGYKVSQTLFGPPQLGEKISLSSKKAAVGIWELSK
jgi:alpha-glucosidase